MKSQKLAKIYSMVFLALSLSFVACSTMPKFSPYVISLKNGKCGEYEMVKSDVCDIQYRFVKWHPLSDCEGYFALSPSDINKLNEYRSSQCSKPQD